MSFIVVIPARFFSNRLQGKPLVDINGKSMVVLVMEKALASGAERVIVATDYPGVVEAIEQVGGEVCLTSSDHHSGIERLAEVIANYGFSDEQIIVNVQVDEPLIPPKIIRQVAENLSVINTGIATLAVPITSVEEAFNVNTVKVVTDMHDYALYFSRATIPWNLKGFTYNHDEVRCNILRHIGVYAYRASFIRRYIKWPVSPLEKIESLEQLRVLWYGEKIYVALAASVVPGIGVDTPEELAQVRKLLQ